MWHPNWNWRFCVCYYIVTSRWLSNQEFVASYIRTFLRASDVNWVVSKRNCWITRCKSRSKRRSLSSDWGTCVAWRHCDGRGYCNNRCLSRSSRCLTRRIDFKFSVRGIILYPSRQNTVRVSHRVGVTTNRNLYCQKFCTNYSRC